MNEWLIVVIGWGIVGPMLAIGASYVISWGMGSESSRPGCRLLGSRRRLQPHHCLFLSKTDRSRFRGSQTLSFNAMRQPRGAHR